MYNKTVLKLKVKEPSTFGDVKEGSEKRQSKEIKKKMTVIKTALHFPLSTAKFVKILSAN